MSSHKITMTSINVFEDVVTVSGVITCDDKEPVSVTVTAWYSYVSKLSVEDRDQYLLRLLKEQCHSCHHNNELGITLDREYTV